MKLKRIVSLLLALVMTMSLITLPSYAEDTDAAKVDVMLSGESVSRVTLARDEKLDLTAQMATNADNAAYQWQIMAAKDLWVNITGAVEQTLSLSYAMVSSVLDNDTTVVRVVAKTADGAVFTSNDITVSVVDAPERVAAAAAPVRSMLKSAPRLLANANDDTDPEKPVIYTIMVQYLLPNGTTAHDPYLATVAAGDSYTATVDFPAVLGYEVNTGAIIDPDHKASVVEGKLQLNFDAVTADTTITVPYAPAMVEYKVEHYFQNVDNADYTIDSSMTEVKEGLTGSTVSDCEKSVTGFYALPYDDAAIAADGSTVVKVYYDRGYYLMTFNLDGGYGVEPIYARYGTPITDVGTPTKAGYVFNGWDKTVPTTMPAENTSYKAKWTAGDATYTVVYWQENADDDGYSYVGDEKKTAKAGTTVSGSDTLATANISTSHVHDVSCYTTQSLTKGDPHSQRSDFTNPADPISGNVYRYRRNSNNYYNFFYLNGTWYYLGTNNTYRGINATISNPTSNNSYTTAPAKTICTNGVDTQHFTYNAGKTDKNIVVNGDGSTVVNVYYTRNVYTLKFRVLDCNRWHTHNDSCYDTVATITDKYDAKISDEFKKAPFTTTYDGYAWEDTGSTYSYPLQTLDRMPGINVTFKLYSNNNTTKRTIHYYVQRIGTTVKANEWPSNANNFTLLKNVNTYFNYATYEEEYHEIQGFTRYSKSVAGFSDSGSRKDFDNNEMSLYYLRNSYNLKFFNYTEDIEDRSWSVQYEAPLGDYYFLPDYPSALEPAAYQFVGWYTTAECFDGSEADLETMTMPAADLILYAKWVPVEHTVNFFLTKDATMPCYDPQYVPHGSKAEPVADPVNGQYDFVGWFYDDNGTEKAFDIANMPVNRNLNLYAKWNSTVKVPYTIKYMTELEDGTAVEIAPPTTGKGLAGISKTFDAKAGTELYADYQEGYFPQTNSHNMVFDIESNNEFTFWYESRESVNYTVRYLDEETGEALIPVKNATTKNAVVTEVFEIIPQYMPDAYQKRMVVSLDEDSNVITFYYHKDTEHAYYTVTHYIQNVEGDGYTVYSGPISLMGKIRDKASATPMTINGFAFNQSKSIAKGTISGDTTLELKLYYDRVMCDYTVNYLEKDTEKQLADPKKVENIRFGATVSETAINIPGYTCDANKTQSLTVKLEGNVINFYYTENQATIKYEVVGPTGCGTVDRASETVKVVTGPATGSTAAVTSNDYKFVGWYSDPACQNPVPTAQVEGNKFTPAKDTASGLYVPATYYAKFEWNVADLTITKTGCDLTKDANQSFIFHVTGNGVDMYVTVQGNDSVIIKGLKVGSYTVEEVTTWSWRYTPDGGAKRTVSVQGGQTNEEIFHNTRTNPYWLSGDCFAVNTFGMGPRGTFVSGN